MKSFFDKLNSEQSTTSGKRDGAAPSGKPDGAAPSGQQDGAASSGQQGGAAPSGQQDGAAPSGGEKLSDNAATEKAQAEFMNNVLECVSAVLGPLGQYRRRR